MKISYYKKKSKIFIQIKFVNVCKAGYANLEKICHF
jgi:hypothetical protein